MYQECWGNSNDEVAFLHFQYLSGNLCECLCANVCGVLHGGDRGHVQTQTLVCTCHSLRLYQQPFNSEGVRLRMSDSFRQRLCWRKSNSQKKLVITQLYLVHELHRYTTSSGASEHRFTSFDFNWLNWVKSHNSTRKRSFVSCVNVCQSLGKSFRAQLEPLHLW